jgi:hypothetical protein
MTTDFTIGATVARKSKGATNGRTGQVIELQGNRARIHWTKKGNGGSMSTRSWVLISEIMVVKPVLDIDAAFRLMIRAENEAKYAAWMKASDLGTMKDDDNPAFMFNTIPSALLSMIVKGEVNANWLAGKVLAGRGQDKDGNWVGFDEAAKIHEVK